ncbi:hypothetical protein HW555_007905 [Spodoptera exigua]|uniref:Uncharacterized protein n=1 Tax=Spodoptera exigua TaxID=7107 RepID=A0A835GF39_SPOEX|nr:hypothetical protein HW555_007905 [Spodoptera exigua]
MKLEESRAMFLSRNGVPVYYRPLSFVTHPEYDSAVYSSIAVVKLAVPNINPLTPICFSNTMYDTGGLHLFGYTDDNDKLEKIVFKIQAVEKQQCDQFYKDEGVSRASVINPPSHPSSVFVFKHDYLTWPDLYDPTELKYFTIEPSYEDKHAIAIYPYVLII